MSDNENNDDLIAERDRLQAEVMALRVERETGVPAPLLAQGRTIEEMQQIAADALQWKGSGGSTPARTTPTAAVYPAGTVNGVSQISKESLKYLTPQQINQVYAENRLAGIGAPRPEPRRTGEQHKNAGP
jgi:hypothetical protein